MNKLNTAFVATVGEPTQQLGAADNKWMRVTIFPKRRLVITLLPSSQGFQMTLKVAGSKDIYQVFNYVSILKAFVMNKLIFEF